MDPTMRHKPYRAFLGTVGCALITTLAVGTAAAQDPPAPDPAAPPPGAPAFSVQPSGPDGPGGRDYFIYDLAPGEQFGDTVAVSNLGDEPVRFALYATDAFNTEDGAGFTLLREEEDPVDVGSWIRLAAEEYVVPPGSRIDVPFSITVPDDATPGDHAGAIVAQPLVEAPAAGDDGLSFDVRFRIGARVYLRVDRPLQPELRITQLDVRQDQGLGPTSGSLRVEYVVRNTGNVRLTPTANLRVTGPLGLTLRTLERRELPELLPGGEVTIAETATGLPLLGRLHAELDVTAEGADVQRTTGAWAVPWSLVVVVGLVLVGWRVRRRRRSRPRRGGGDGGATDRRRDRDDERVTV
jgi:hypothetical protein